jgi:hypothetical protein
MSTNNDGTTKSPQGGSSCCVAGDTCSEMKEVLERNVEESIGIQNLDLNEWTGKSFTYQQSAVTLLTKLLFRRIPNLRSQARN